MGTPWITLSCLYHVKGQEGRKLGNPFEGSSKLESGFTQNVQGGNLMRTTQGEHENCVTSSMMEWLHLLHWNYIPMQGCAGPQESWQHAPLPIFVFDANAASSEHHGSIGGMEISKHHWSRPFLFFGELVIRCVLAHHCCRLLSPSPWPWRDPGKPQASWRRGRRKKGKKSGSLEMALKPRIDMPWGKQRNSTRSGIRFT